MSRILICAACTSMLLGTVAARPALAETVVAIDVSPLVYGTAKYIMGNNNNKRRTVRYYQPSQQSPSRGQFVVPDSSRFPGSYYVENGKHYFRANPSSPGAGPVVVKRGECSHVKDLAKRLEYEARTMCHDMADNYRDNPGYPAMYREAYRIWQLAKQISQREGESDQAATSALVRDLDSRFQPLRREVSGWSGREQSQRGEGTLQAKVERAEAVIHHLWNDVGPVQNTWVARADVAAPRLSAPENGSTTILK